MLAVTRRRGKDVDPRFAELPGDEHPPRWQEIDQCLPADHLACQIAQAVEELDLAGRDGAANELPMRSGGL